MNDIKIEIADIGDAVEIARISYQVGKMHDEAVPEYFKPTDEKEHLRIVTDILKEKNVITFKAVCNGKLCGFLFLEVRERTSRGLSFSKVGVILNFGVDEICRRKGVGAALMMFVEEYTKAQGLEALDLNVFSFNKNAINFYQKLGYQITDLNMRKILK